MSSSIIRGTYSSSILDGTYKYIVATSSNSLYQLVIDNERKDATGNALSTGKKYLRIMRSGVSLKQWPITDTTSTFTKIKLKGTAASDALKLTIATATGGTEEDITIFSSPSDGTASYVQLENDGNLALKTSSGTTLASSATTSNTTPSAAAPSATTSDYTKYVELASDLKELEEIFLNKNIIMYSVLIIIFTVTLIMIIVFMFTLFKKNMMGCLSLIIMNGILLAICIIMLIVQAMSKKKSMKRHLQYKSASCGKHQKSDSSGCILRDDMDISTYQS